MNEHLWKGAELKLEYASLHLLRMREALFPPTRTPMTVALQASGSYIELDWQRHLYAHLDALLPCVRSVADIINCCFGHDTNSKMKAWFDGLPIDEQDRRKQFTARFQPERQTLDDHVLTKERDVSVHRAGYPDLKVAFTGFFGVRYQANPTIRLNSTDVQQDDAAMGWLGQPIDLRPMEKDFEIGGLNLFAACNQYIQAAKDVLDKARAIASNVHGSKPLTNPPA